MSILYSPPHKNRDWQGKRKVLSDGTVVYMAFDKYHRDNGPAVARSAELAKTTLRPIKEYYKRGSLHRFNGPARIWGELPLLDTRLFLELPKNQYLEDTPILLAHLKEEWFYHDTRHREGGPAIVALGEEQYWQEGKLHRTDGPAVIRGEAVSHLRPRHFAKEGHSMSREEYWQEGKLLRRILMNGTREWFCENQLHRTDGPAVERDPEYANTDEARSRKEDAVFEYRKRGLLHRTDGPALMRWDRERSCFHYQWFIEGRLENGYGPSEVWLNGDRVWRKDGVAHRSDGPAIVLSGGEKLWLKEGKKSRANGPAVILGDAEEYWLDGLLHRTDGPAIEDREKEIYYENGKRHRTDGPALIVHGKYHEWYQRDLLHRETAPAVWRSIPFAIAHDLASEEYYHQGKLDRSNGPAKIYPDGSKFYYKGGKLDREDGPAIKRDEKRARLENKPLLEYYKNDKRHRADGPSVVWPGGKEEYWLDGVKCTQEYAKSLQENVTQKTLLGNPD
jgi:hypothetical protein